MKSQDIRKGDRFEGRTPGTGYEVTGDVKQVDAPEAWWAPGARPDPAPQYMRVAVKFVDGGTEYRWFALDQDVPLTRPSDTNPDPVNRPPAGEAHDVATRPGVYPRATEAMRDMAPGRLDRYAVVEGDDLIALANAIRRAQAYHRPVRFTVRNGLKWDAGDGWTPSMGRPGNETGH